MATNPDRNGVSVLKSHYPMRAPLPCRVASDSMS
jgi:hypothetical protein